MIIIITTKTINMNKSSNDDAEIDCINILVMINN